MKIATGIPYAGGFEESIKEVQALDKAGVDLVWVAEAYGFDAVSLMGYLAAKTENIRIASGILPIYTRTPSLLAMTAAGVDQLSGGRCVLGIGTSGPQVIEGFHGVPFDAPLGRIREVIQICRKIWRRKVLVHEGKRYQLPLPAGQGTGLGKPLKMITKPVREQIPIIVAALNPRSVQQTAEIADGWLPVFYHPTRARNRWGEALDAGAAKRDSSLGPLEVFAGGAVGFGDGLEKLRDRARPNIALYVGGMGARGKNFYNELFASYGFADEAKTIQDLYLSGKKEEAAAAIPQQFLDETSLIGPEGYVRDRLAEYKASGVTTLSLSPVGKTIDDRLRTLDQTRNLIAKL